MNTENLTTICEQHVELVNLLSWAMEYGTFDVAVDNSLHASMLDRAQKLSATLKEDHLL